MDNRNPIILIGPSGVGKSIVSNNLSNFLDMPLVEADEGGFDRFKKYGFSPLVAKILFSALGHYWVYRYSKSFEFKDTINLLKCAKNEVIDLGAGSVIYHNRKQQIKLKHVLLSFQHVFLLLPSPNKQESLQYLNEIDPFLASLKPNINEYFNNFNYQELAKYTLYVKGKSLYEISQQIGDIVISNKIVANQ